MKNGIHLIRGEWAVAIAFGLGFLISGGLPVRGQTTQSNQSTQQEQPSGEKPATAEKPPVNKEEEDAYKALSALTGQQSPEVISEAEAFLAKYPTSLYRANVYFRLVNAYLSTGQAANAVTTGEKAIVENPENMNVLSLESTVLPRVTNPNALDFEQKLGEAERFAKRSIELVNAMQKPEGNSDEQFARWKNERLGMAHYGLGLVAYMRGNTAVSVDEFDQSSKIDPAPEPLLFFLLGTGEMKLQKYPDAQTAFEHCAKDPWQWQDRCKSSVEQAKKATAAPAKP